MQSLVAAGIGGVGGLVLLGMDGQVQVPLIGGLSAPLGSAIHVGLASYLGKMAEPAVEAQITQLKGYGDVAVTAVATPALLYLAGDDQLGMGMGAVLGGASDLAAKMLFPTQGTHQARAMMGYNDHKAAPAAARYWGQSGGCGCSR
jgi:hypothetical protein